MEAAMQKNMGSFDRIARVIVALVIGVLYLADQISGLAAIILGAFAVVFVLTSLMGSCPLYGPLKINTMGKSETK
jgi:hypothetical protein